MGNVLGEMQYSMWFDLWPREWPFKNLNYIITLIHRLQATLLHLNIIATCLWRSRESA